MLIGTAVESVRPDGVIVWDDVELDPPSVTLRMPRDSVAQRTGALLQSCEIDDLNVEDPPIEEIIGMMFADAEKKSGGQGHEESNDA